MRVVYISIVFLQCLNFAASAQIAKIIEARNEVMVKKHASSRWGKAQVDTYLEREAEIKTGAASSCTIAFDEQLKNILTIEENSQIRLENIQPGVLYLPRGRVFSLIEDIALIQEFKVRTPVAIAGVRGTGESVESTQNGTTIRCFEGKAYVQLFDTYGTGLMERAVFEGLGVYIGMDGRLGDMFFLDERDYEQWDGFRAEITDSRAERGTLPRSFYEQKEKKAKPFTKKRPAMSDMSLSESEESPPADEEIAPLQERFNVFDDEMKRDRDAFDDIDMLKEERRSDFQDSSFEKIRKYKDRRSGSSGQ